MDSSGGNRKDPRREPGIDEDDCPTDVGIGTPQKPALRLTAAPTHDDVEPNDATDVGPARDRLGIASAAIPRSIRARLEPKSGPVMDRGAFEITMVRTEIGRGLQADLRIRDRKLSRSHAIIFFTGTEFRIRDEGSANGTMLNGSAVVEYRLQNGDELAIGRSLVVFRVGDE